MKTKFNYLAYLVMLISTTITAQNVGINSTGSAPNNSAGLDVDFTNKGLLIPRVALTSATDGATIPSPATSLLVYNTGTGGLSPAGYYYNAGTSSSPNWVKLLNTGSPTEAWLTTGNAGTTAGTHFLGTTDNVDLVFKTNNIERMRILNAGRVGINTSTPGSYYLDVLSNNSSIDGIRGYHTSGTTTSAFAAVTGSVSNTSYTTATGYLGYHNSNNGRADGAKLRSANEVCKRSNFRPSAGCAKCRSEARHKHDLRSSSARPLWQSAEAKRRHFATTKLLPYMGMEAI